MGKTFRNNMITLIVIAKNCEQTIEKFLRSFRWVDEIILVDNESSDLTAKKARIVGAKVLIVSGNNFSTLRNSAVEKASSDWLLYIDTDEEIPERLKQEILKITSTTPSKDEYQAYVIKRKNYYLGKHWPYEDGMIRLIYTSSLVRWFGELHETAEIKGDVGELKARLIHRTHTSLESMLDKTNKWSNAEAKLRFDAHHPDIVSWRLFRVFFTGFWEYYVRQSGWKVGTVGIIESIYQGFSLCITYMKLWELQQHKIQK
jgi:glycosyltransferase involved in cell wall biosynthesis